ncbi:MAG: hypothetical protein M3430_00830 [Acidobacteriota bacterium]|nr:hypothetical protein [Acidobacteriota bacterium]
MKRFKRIAALLIVGFLTFAPPGTMIFGVTLVLGLGGYLLNRSGDTERSAPPPAASPTRSAEEGCAPAAEKPKSISELPAYLETILPPEAKGTVRTQGGGVFADFALADAPSQREDARNLAGSFILAAYDAGLPLETAGITIRRRNGDVGLAVTLGANAAAKFKEGGRVDPGRNSTDFMSWMKDARRLRGDAEGVESARVDGAWSE